MKLIERIPLSEFFKGLKTPQYVLGTTYTASLAFFESLVLPHIRASKLKHCLILCDVIGYHRAMAEGPALQAAAQRYLVVPAPAAGSFHPKFWLIVDEGVLALLVGSGNLTQSGFMQNVEVFDVLQGSAELPLPVSLRAELLTFLNGLKSLWPPADHKQMYAIEIIDAIRERLELFPTRAIEKRDPRFLSSFAGTLIDQLPTEGTKGRLHIATPFFGGGIEGIQLLRKRYPKSELIIYPAIHEDASIDLPLRLAQKSVLNAKWYALDLGDQKGRLAHVKMYGYESEGQESWLFCASANCTLAALSGNNIEAGLFRWVSAETVRSFFSRDRNIALPNKKYVSIQSGEAYSTLPIWAVDVGDAIVLRMSERGNKEIPLRDVQISLLSGCQKASHLIKNLFTEHLTEQISWSRFSKWNKSDRMAVILELRGLSAKGQPVKATCFVENYALLSADPIDRTAFRAALQLVEQGVIPQYAELAAIFTLTRLIFDGRLPDPDCTTTALAVLDEKDVPSEKLPLWPPQAVIHGAEPVNQGGAGHLHWYQKILGLFLQPPDQSTKDTVDNDGDDDDTKDDNRKTKIASPSVPDPTARRTWEETEETFEAMFRRIDRQHYTEEQAKAVWPAAILILLLTLIVRRRIVTTTPSLDISQAKPLLARFLVLCFSYRGMDWQKSPPLPELLFEKHAVAIHVDLACVIGTALATVAFGEDQNDSWTGAWLRLKAVSDVAWNPTEAIAKKCMGIWRLCMCEPGEEHRETAFLAHWQNMWTLRWTNHRGFQQYQTLRIRATERNLDPPDLKDGFRGDVSAFLKQLARKKEVFLTVDPALAVCSFPGCNRAYQYDPDKTSLAQWMPVICRGCGTVLVPRPLVNIERDHADLAR